MIEPSEQVRAAAERRANVLFYSLMRDECEAEMNAARLANWRGRWCHISAAELDRKPSGNVVAFRRVSP